MRKLINWFRDLYRGYTDEDIYSAYIKITKSRPKPGSIIPLTNAEFKAFIKNETPK